MSQEVDNCVLSTCYIPDKLSRFLTDSRAIKATTLIGAAAHLLLHSDNAQLTQNTDKLSEPGGGV